MAFITIIFGVSFLSVINCHPLNSNKTFGFNGILETMMKNIEKLRLENVRINEKLSQQENLQNTLKKIHEQQWYLGMNLNPNDGHIMGYATGWDDGMHIGKKETAFTKDYLSSEIWKMPVNRIAIVRHQNGIFEAVKVWTFKNKMISMLDRFKAMFPGREIATQGGPRQVFIPLNMRNQVDDPIFSLPGDLAINWWYGNNGCRIALTGGNLSPANSNDDNTHGLGNDLAIDGKTGRRSDGQYAHEISNNQDCPLGTCPTANIKIQGKDHQKGLKSGPVYGSYAIYVSLKAEQFPLHNIVLSPQMNGCN